MKQKKSETKAKENRCQITYPERMASEKNQVIRNDKSTNFGTSGRKKKQQNAKFWVNAIDFSFVEFSRLYLMIEAKNIILSIVVLNEGTGNI